MKHANVICFIVVTVISALYIALITNVNFKHYKNIEALKQIIQQENLK